MNRFKSLTFLISIFMVAAFSSTSFAGSAVPNYGAFGGEKVDWKSNDIGAMYAKDWTKDQIKAFVKKPWTKEEKEKLLGDEGMGYVLEKNGFPMEKAEGDLTPKQLYMNGKAVWMPIMLQYGLGMNMKTFKKIWIDEGKYKDSKHFLLDIRMESEYLQGHIPGAIRLDTGLDFWYLPGLAPDPAGTYYLQCKSGTPADGGIRGALVARHMRMMGYTGPIYNLTDGFRGWLEEGYPIINRHGQFKLVPGTFQKPDPNFLKNKYPKTLKYSPQP
ncbi:MAG: rhodanese-like domain-containing protein [Deltaproteobacteria bacterium]|nr:rhodanese-like domain-containing protein [Deltaproteobacteria bacterium]